MKYAVLYESAPDAASKIPHLVQAHKAWWAGFHDAGTLVAIGPFADGTGALAVFTTREAAEEFVAGDPFVVEAAMSRWEIREWLEVLL